MRKLKIILVVAFIGVLFLVGINRYGKIKNEDISFNQVGDKVKVSGETLDSGRMIFRTDCQLESAGEAVPSWIYIELEAETKYNEKSKKYELTNPKLLVKPIACEQYESNVLSMQSSKYNNIYRLGIKLNQKYSEEIKVKYAKQLAQNDNVEIIKITDNNGININSEKDLLKSNKNDESIFLEYKIKRNSYIGYFLVSFELLSDKEGEFIVK